jgi:hypothetical protein
MFNFKYDAEKEAKLLKALQVNPENAQATPSRSYSTEELKAASFWHGEPSTISSIPSDKKESATQSTNNSAPIMVHV